MRSQKLNKALIAFLLFSIPYIFPSMAHAISTNPTPVCTTNCQVTFTFTGDTYTWTVPAGVTSLQITLAGAQGGTSGSSQGGKGGIDTGTLSVTPGATIYVLVGGQNGFNGGGAAGATASYSAAPGGGATDIRLGGNALINRYMVAGGGGGGGRNNCPYQTGGMGGYPGGTGGAGDGRYGDTGTLTAGGSTTYSGTVSNSTCSSSGTGGGGGGQRGGGGGGGYGTSIGGTNGTCGSGNSSVNSTNAANADQGGCLGIGGNGGNYSSNGNGGGGGGGYYGGGAGGANWGTGGGGGSSFIDSVTAATYLNGARTGDGYAMFVYALPSPTTISLSDSQNGQAVFRTADVITAILTGSNGKVKFFVNGKPIAGCQNIQSSGLQATCTWRPSIHGTVTLFATLAPPGGFSGSRSANLQISVITRSNNR